MVVAPSLWPTFSPFSIFHPSKVQGYFFVNLPLAVPLNAPPSALLLTHSFIQTQRLRSRSINSGALDVAFVPLAPRPSDPSPYLVFAIQTGFLSPFCLFFLLLSSLSLSLTLPYPQFNNISFLSSSLISSKAWLEPDPALLYPGLSFFPPSPSIRVFLKNKKNPKKRKTLGEMNSSLNWVIEYL